jgi:hypothetical protein
MRRWRASTMGSSSSPKVRSNDDFLVAAEAAGCTGVLFPPHPLSSGEASGSLSGEVSDPSTLSLPGDRDLRPNSPTFCALSSATPADVSGVTRTSPGFSCLRAAEATAAKGACSAGLGGTRCPITANGAHSAGVSGAHAASFKGADVAPLCVKGADSAGGVGARGTCCPSCVGKGAHSAPLGPSRIRYVLPLRTPACTSQLSSPNCSSCRTMTRRPRSLIPPSFSQRRRFVVSTTPSSLASSASATRTKRALFFAFDSRHTRLLTSDDIHASHPSTPPPHQSSGYAALLLTTRRRIPDVLRHVQDWLHQSPSGQCSRVVRNADE